MFKFNFHNKLVNYDLLITGFASFSFGFIMPIMMKFKGLYLATSILGLLLLIDKIAGLVQPIILKSNLKLTTILKITMFFDCLWSFNILTFAWCQYDFVIFLYLNFIINLFCSICFVNIDLKTTKLVASLTDLEEFQTMKFTFNNLLMMISTGLCSLACLIYNPIYVLAFGAILNLFYQWFAYQMIDLVKIYEKE